MDTGHSARLLATYLTLAVFVVSGCDETPVAVSAVELGDVTMPEFAAAKRGKLSDNYQAGPAPFEAIECENTYIDGEEPPSPPLPSLWVRQDGQLTRVDGLASIGGSVEERWADRRWSASFRHGDARLVCDGEKISQPQVGDAYLAYLYPRVLLDGVEWLRPAPREITPSEQAELEAMGPESWTRDQAQRLIEIHPNRWSGDWGQHWRNAIAWAEETGDDDLEYELRRRYQPIGKCGNDRYPSRVRNALRNHCLSTRRFGCVAELHGWTSPPLPQPAYDDPRALPPGTDALRYRLGILLDFPGSFRSDIKAGGPNFQDREFVRAFHDLALELAQLGETDAYTRHQLAVLAYRAGSRLADLEHMDNAPDRTLASLTVPDRVYEQRLREMAERKWLPSATRERFVRQADRLGALIQLEQDAKWDALREEQGASNLGTSLWIEVGPDTSSFTTRPPENPEP